MGAGAGRCCVRWVERLGGVVKDDGRIVRRVWFEERKERNFRERSVLVSFPWPATKKINVDTFDKSA